MAVTHIAIAEAPDGKSAGWTEQVSDEPSNEAAPTSN
jgi:hypothetical protein